MLLVLVDIETDDHSPAGSFVRKDGIDIVPLVFVVYRQKAHFPGKEAYTLLADLSVIARIGRLEEIPSVLGMDHVLGEILP